MVARPLLRKNRATTRGSRRRVTPEALLIAATLVGSTVAVLSFGLDVQRAYDAGESEPPSTVHLASYLDELEVSARQGRWREAETIIYRAVHVLELVDSPAAEKLARVLAAESHSNSLVIEASRILSASLDRQQIAAASGTPKGDQ